MKDDLFTRTLSRWGLRMLTWALSRTTGEKVNVQGIAMSYCRGKETAVRRQATGIELGYPRIAARMRDALGRMPHQVTHLEDQAEACLLGAPGVGKYRTSFDMKEQTLDWREA